tara:strand:+ start:474 stop:623 length:150 start_codon:yes stop_codon:yes gene_type:complete
VGKYLEVDSNRYLYFVFVRVNPVDLVVGLGVAIGILAMVSIVERKNFGE